MDKVKKTVLGVGLAAAALLGGIAVGNAAAPDDEATCHTNPDSGETTCTVPYESEETGETASNSGGDYEQSSSEDPQQSEGRKKTSVKIEYVDYEEKAF